MHVYLYTLREFTVLNLYHFLVKTSRIKHRYMCVCVINLIMIHVLPFYRFTLHVQHLPALLSTTA